MRVVDRRDSLDHLSVVFHNLLEDLILLIVENTSVQILLELLKENGVFLAYQQRKNRHLDRLKGTNNVTRDRLLQGDVCQR